MLREMYIVADTKGAKRGCEGRWEAQRQDRLISKASRAMLPLRIGPPKRRSLSRFLQLKLELLVSSLRPIQQ